MRRAAGVGAAALALLILGGCSDPDHRATTTLEQTTSAPTSTKPPPRKPPPRHVAPGVRRPGISTRTITFVDHSRTVMLPATGTVPRRLATIVRYPRGARGPLPLVVFGHGFAVTPRPYARLLDAWAKAGYVVAAPTFPLENAHAPGGPNESDLVNQPRDMSFVISQMLASGLVDARRIAVAGQSDGGETALAVAYDRHFLDRRVDAAVILSGAEIPGVGGFDFPLPSPPLLATQGTADTINPPSFTNAFFAIAPPPKYLLRLLGASHLGPYTDQQPQLQIVERVTIAFLDAYVKHARGALSRMLAAGDVPGLATLLADR
jgi:dienelactone hydrolase